METSHSNAKQPRPVFIIKDVLEETHARCLDFCQMENNQQKVLMISGNGHGVISIWDLSTYRRLHRFMLQDYLIGDIQSVDGDGDNLRIDFICYISSRKQLIVYVGSNARVFLFQLLLNPIEDNDGVELKCLHQWKSFDMTFAKCFPLQEKFLAFLDPLDSKLIDMVDLDMPNNKICKIKTSTDKDHGIITGWYLFTFKFSDKPENLFIIQAYENGFLLLFRTTGIPIGQDSADSVLVSEFKSHEEMITCMDFNETLMYGISCNVLDEIVVWRIITFDENLKFDDQRVRRIKIRNQGITCCSIRKDGKIFAVGAKDGRIRVFQTKSAKPLAVMAYHSDTIETIRFTPNLTGGDSKKFLLLASSHDKSMSVWDIYND